jgi:hypothetical protein
MQLDDVLTASTVAGGSCEVFRDIGSIPAGSDFADDIVGAVTSCDIVLAMIGRHWLTIDGVRRIDHPDDFVRLELATAIAAGIPVVVVLVDGAARPRAAELPTDILQVAMSRSVRIDNAHFEESVEQVWTTLVGLGIASRGGPALGTHALGQRPARLVWWLFDLRRAPSVSSLTIGGCAGCSATVLGAGSFPGSGTRRRRVSPA